MRAGVMLDTSFLITLADPRRDRHPVAKQYFQHFLVEKMPMLVSAIVVAEPGGRRVLVTDMGDLPAMTAPGGAFWPLDSEQAKNLVPRGRVYRVTLDGQVSVAIDRAPGMPNPNGVDALPDGAILVAEFFRGTLLEWRAGWCSSRWAGDRETDGKRGSLPSLVEFWQGRGSSGRGFGCSLHGMKTPVIAQKSPYAVNVEAGKSYAWCACGRSKGQPFCDGSHKGSGFAPTMYKADKTGTVYFCGCKHSKTGTLCDGTHKTL